MKYLTSLNLSFTNVTDAGLKDLARLENLKSLELNATKVTFAGFRDIEKALPKCTIRY